jgi:hypothetical protein
MLYLFIYLLWSQFFLSPFRDFSADGGHRSKEFRSSQRDAAGRIRDWDKMVWIPCFGQKIHGKRPLEPWFVFGIARNELNSSAARRHRQIHRQPKQAA